MLANVEVGTSKKFHRILMGKEMLRLEMGYFCLTEITSVYMFAGISE
jgi:hypothetical protein